jgi:hypothetical protein
MKKMWPRSSGSVNLLSSKLNLLEIELLRFDRDDVHVLAIAGAAPDAQILVDHDGGGDHVQPGCELELVAGVGLGNRVLQRVSSGFDVDRPTQRGPGAHDE